MRTLGRGGGIWSPSPIQLSRSCFNRKGEIFSNILAHIHQHFRPLNTLCWAWTFSGKHQMGCFSFLLFSKVASPTWWHLCNVPSPNIIFLEPSRKNKRQLGESLCICSSLRLNACLDTARESGVCSGKEQLLTLSLGWLQSPLLKKLRSSLPGLHLTLTTQRRSLMAQRVAQIGSELRYYQDNTPLSRFLKLQTWRPFLWATGRLWPFHQSELEVAVATCCLARERLLSFTISI